MFRLGDIFRGLIHHDVENMRRAALRNEIQRDEYGRTQEEYVGTEASHRLDAATRRHNVSRGVVAQS